jgi:hypothetical protein
MANDCIILNGPQMSERRAILYGRSALVYFDGKWLSYDRAPDDVEAHIGPALVVVGTTHAAMDENAGVIFAHPEHQPTFLDYRTSTLHPCEFSKEADH